VTTPTKAFATADVLSVITGTLIADISGVYEVLSWMTGESVYTHQIPRISREAEPVLLAVHPALAQAIEEAEQVTTENWREWRGRWEARYGMTIVVPKFTADQHEYREPVSEAVEMLHPSRVAVVKL